MYHYFYLPDDELIARREQTKPKFERYDTVSGQWVPDWELSGICSGDIKSIPCKTEEEAWTKLNSQN